MREYLVSFSRIPLRLRNTYLAFLAKNGLTDEGDCDFTAMLLDDLDNILACGSLRGNVLKQIAVTPSAEGSGYCAQIISALVAKSFERGAAHQFLYTKPMHRNIFRSMGFYPIVETNDVLMMENRPRGIQTFLKSLPHPSGKVGAVVCNCNPFTLGHRHLIEQASRSCDAVLVFVLSEDASFFSAADRFELVRAGTADLKNVHVVRSEEYLVETENENGAAALHSRFTAMGRNGNQLTFSEQTYAPFEVMAAVAQQRIPIIKIERLEPSLEALFMEVVEK